MSGAGADPGPDEVRAVAAARWGLSGRHLRERDLRVAASALGLDGGDCPQSEEDAIASLTVGETYFFRDRAQLRILEETLLPDVLAKTGRVRPLRLWSAGCSTGEEAWTLAMLAERAWPDPAARPDVSVVGTDLNEAAIRKAQEGVYGRWSFRGVSEATIQRCFERVPGGLRVADRFRPLVRFSTMNLADPLAAPPWRAGAVDVILCRNVITYFTEPSARAVVARLRDCLAPWGCLLVSPSEAMLPLFDGLTPVVAPDATVFRVDRGRVPAHPAPPRTAPVRGHDRAQGPAARTLPRPRRSARAVPVAPPVQQVAPGRSTEREEAADRFRRGLAAREEGDLGRSIELLRSAVFVDPSYAPPHLALAGVLALSGATTRARKELDVAAGLLVDLPRDLPIVEGDAEVTAGRMLELVAVQRRVLTGVGDRA